MFILEYFLQSPESIVNIFGFGLAILTFGLTSYWDRSVQRRQNYLRLEFESIALFRFCSENPDVPRFLDGKLKETDERLYEMTYWFVCQTLNLFEIAVSYRKQKMISDEVFATWVSWFHELGTAPAFKGYWAHLRFHYVAELGSIMDAALEASTIEQGNDQLYMESLQQFHGRVAHILSDPGIMNHFRRSLPRRERTMGLLPLRPSFFKIVAIVILLMFFFLLWRLVS